MLQTILSRNSVSVTEFRRKPVECVKAGKGEAVAILSNNEPVFYCIPAQRYGELLQELEEVKSKLEAVGN